MRFPTTERSSTWELENGSKGWIHSRRRSVSQDSPADPTLAGHVFQDLDTETEHFRRTVIFPEAR